MSTRSTRFGHKLRSLREAKGLGLRELARRAGVSPAFLSKVESGKEKPPAEKKLKAVAKALNYDPDILIALSGRLPTDVMKIIQRHPQQYLGLLKDLRNRNAPELESLRTQLYREKSEYWSKGILPADPISPSAVSKPNLALNKK